MAPESTQPEVEPTDAALLVEYQKAQDSAQFHDGVVWTSTGISWAMSVVLLGFALAHLDLKIPITAAAVLGVCVVCFQLQVQALCRSIKGQKYERCRQIEGKLGMRANRELKYRPAQQTLFYRAISVCFIALWACVLFVAWTR